MARGYDFRFGYGNGWEPEENYPDEETVVQGQCSQFDRYLAIDPMRHIGTASCFLDTTPRHTQRWADMGYGFFRDIKIYHQDAMSFRRILRHIKTVSDQLPEGAWAKRILMLDNWNEWDEGHFVAPSHKFGFAYLQAIREELTARDNLPDYRTPADQGFNSYNRSWPTPDFSRVCKERLERE